MSIPSSGQRFTRVPVPASVTEALAASRGARLVVVSVMGVGPGSPLVTDASPPPLPQQPAPHLDTIASYAPAPRVIDWGNAGHLGVVLPASAIVDDASRGASGSCALPGGACGHAGMDRDVGGCIGSAFGNAQRGGRGSGTNAAGDAQVPGAKLAVCACGVPGGPGGTSSAAATAADPAIIVAATDAAGVWRGAATAIGPGAHAVLAVLPGSGGAVVATVFK